MKAIGHQNFERVWAPQGLGLDLGFRFVSEWTQISNRTRVRIYAALEITSAKFGILTFYDLSKIFQLRSIKSLSTFTWLRLLLVRTKKERVNEQNYALCVITKVGIKKNTLKSKV